MRNPKTFKATPYEHWKPTDKSHTGTHELAHNGTRKEKKTSYDHWMATPADEALDPIPANTKTHPKLGMRMEMNSGHVGDGKMHKVPHSMPDVPVEAKSWKKKGYPLKGTVLEDF